MHTETPLIKARCVPSVSCIWHHASAGCCASAATTLRDGPLLISRVQRIVARYDSNSICRRMGCCVQGLFQKAVVIGVCMHVALDTIAAHGQAPLTQGESSTLLQRLSNIEAAGSDKLIAATATVVADALAKRNTAEVQLDIASLENEVHAKLDTALSPGGSALQATAAEIVHVVQALLVFGRCEGFEGLPEPYVAKTVPPKWANALLVQSIAPNALHGMVGEVAHDLGRICAVAEAAYADLLETLFVEQ